MLFTLREEVMTFSDSTRCYLQCCYNTDKQCDPVVWWFGVGPLLRLIVGLDQQS